MVRWAPSAVNRQPWRVVVDGNEARFYEARTLGRPGAEGWDIQKIDMGIAMYHFAAAVEQASGDWEFRPGAPSEGLPEKIFPVATFTLP